MYVDTPPVGTPLYATTLSRYDAVTIVYVGYGTTTLPWSCSNQVCPRLTPSQLKSAKRISCFLGLICAGVGLTWGGRLGG